MFHMWLAHIGTGEVRCLGKGRVDVTETTSFHNDVQHGQMSLNVVSPIYHAVVEHSQLDPTLTHVGRAIHGKKIRGHGHCTLVVEVSSIFRTTDPYLRKFLDQWAAVEIQVCDMQHSMGQWHARFAIRIGLHLHASIVSHLHTVQPSAKC